MTKVGAAEKPPKRHWLDQPLRHCANSADDVVELLGTLCRVDDPGSYRSESVHGGLPPSIVNEPWSGLHGNWFPAP
jgi:hypothetical protein